MKKYRQLVKELPSKKVVFAFGRFQPPTTGHALLVNFVKKLAQKQGADHFIYASKTQDKKTNPLPVDKKVYYLKRMFPGTNFMSATKEIPNFLEIAAHLNKKYKNLVMVAGSDRVAAFKEYLEKYNGDLYNFDTIEVISAGERDPDAEGAVGMSGTKMREAAKKNDFASFKKGIPSSMTTQDAKRLMNDIRAGMGLDTIKEQVTFERDELREKYHAGEIFNVGESVVSSGKLFEIVKRGSNHLLLKDENGSLMSKWITEVSLVNEDIQPGYAPQEITFAGYTTKNLHHSADAARAFTSTVEKFKRGEIKDKESVLHALKATDTYMKINDKHLEQGGLAPDENELKTWREAHQEARNHLNKIGEFLHHLDYWHTHEHEIQDMEAKYMPSTAGAEMADSYNPKGTMVEETKTIRQTDKIRVAKVIADSLGVKDAENKTNPEQLINDSLRKIRNKPMRPEYVEVVHNMLKTAREFGIKFDEKLVPQKAKEVSEGVFQQNGTDKVGSNTSVYETEKSAMDDPAFHRALATLKKKAAQGPKKTVWDPKTQRYKVVPVNPVKEEVSSILEQIATAAMMGKDTEELKKKLSDVRNNIKDTESDLDSDELEKQAQGKFPAEVGRGLIAPHQTPTHRRMKVKYATEEVDLEEKVAEPTGGLKDACWKGYTAIGMKTKNGRKVPNCVPKESVNEEEETVEEGFDAFSPTPSTPGNTVPNDVKMPIRNKKAMNLSEDEDEDEDDELDDKELEKMADDIEDVEDIIDAYDDDELAIVDDEGEEVESIKEETEQINEVLSRMERIRAKIRFAKTQAKRERKLQVALRKPSSASTLNSRARRLAIKLLKKRMAKKPLQKLSIGEKERLEKVIQKRKKLIDRLAMRLVPKVKAVETNRLQHKKFTK